LKTATLLVLALFLMAVGCGPTLGPQDNAELQGLTDVHQCKATADAGRPMLVEWPATEKTALQSAATRGLVVVRYDGCRLKLLDRCEAGGGYAFTETSRSRDGFVVRDRGELYARLPLGAVKLEAELGEETSLELSYVAVGTRDADLDALSRGQLSGACEGSTHFVRGMVVGAYELARATASDVAAGAGVASAGLGGRHEASRQVIRGDGNLEACLDDTTPADDTRCQAVVQLVLEPIDDTRPVSSPESARRARAAEPPVESKMPHAFSDWEYYPCQAGRTWTDGGCDGTASRSVWDEAMRACPAGWLPASRAALVDLLEMCDHSVYNLGIGTCSPCAKSGPCVAVFGTGSIASGAYWTSTAHDDGKAAFYVSFKDGKVRRATKNNHFEVLCVRQKQ
jgi:hypothetical protein